MIARDIGRSRAWSEAFHAVEANHAVEVKSLAFGSGQLGLKVAEHRDREV